ncbi:MAG TPA: methionine biosynthesis protein MetW [Armatimonadota bacterium]
MSAVNAQPLLLAADGHRADYEIIVRMVSEGARVLDLGCGTGELLERLVRERRATARGVDLHQPSVSACISKGLSVFHGDIHEGLADLRDDSFDYVILSRTLQQVPDPDHIIHEMLRVGTHAIVSFPNFAFWRVRLHLLCQGTLPISQALPYAWYNTPNIRLITLADFTDFCQKQDLAILAKAALDTRNATHPRLVHHCINWRAEYGIFMLGKASHAG